MHRLFRFVACLGVALCVAGCNPKGVDITRFGLEDAVIAADLGLFPQDLTVYARNAGEDTVLMAPERQDEEDARFDRNFFAAWDSGVSHLPKDAVFEALTAMSPARGFAENLRPWNKDRWESLVVNCLMELYGEFPVRPAITVGTAHLRRMPTDAPYFLDPNKGGEGFPFDYMQNSTLWVGTPVAVIHLSRDRMWAYVQTRLVSGWTRVTNLAAVDKAFMTSWRSRPLGVIVQDNVSLGLMERARDAVTGGATGVAANVGTILPFATDNGNIRILKSPHVLVHVPLRDMNGKASIAVAASPMFAVRLKPLPLTPGEIALVGNAMMGQPYGWGGLFGQRDCSALMRDLFTPFGLWLPRNSGPQGKMGARLDLTGLTPERKEEKILREGVPFFSLVSLPGHVGLYLGAYPQSEEPGGAATRAVPAMFHTLWGLRVVGEQKGQDGTREEGRGVIGKAVVTSLAPGAEHPGIASPASLLDRVNGLAILGK